MRKAAEDHLGRNVLVQLSCATVVRKLSPETSAESRQVTATRLPSTQRWLPWPWQQRMFMMCAADTPAPALHLPPDN